MYQPRFAMDIVDDPEVIVDEAADPAEKAAAVIKPRRAARTWKSTLATRIGPAAVALAATATAGALVFTSTSGSTPATANAENRQNEVVSRDTERVALDDQAPSQNNAASVQAPMLKLTKAYASSQLNVRAKPSAKSKKVDVVEAGAQVMVTSEKSGDYTQIIFEKGFGWVSSSGLTDTKPTEKTAEDSTTQPPKKTDSPLTGTSMTPCHKSSSIEAKIRPDTKLIYRSVCARFPGVNSYGGWRAGGLPFHRNGRAIDIMLTPGKESAMGWSIARYLVSNASRFNVDHIIFEQKIWTPRSPHWRHMADRGSTTANHYDHVHVAVRA